MNWYKEAYMFKKILLVFIAVLILFNSEVYSKTFNVAYGGVFTAGEEKNYPNYMKLVKNYKITKEISEKLKKLSNEGKFNFNLMFETDVESTKYDPNTPCTLAIVITRDDLISEKFDTGVATVYKNYVNVGISAIFYLTDEVREAGETKNRYTIIYSIPITGYIFNLEGGKQLTEEKLLLMFKENFSKIIDNKLSQRLSNLRLDKIVGKATKIDGNNVTLNIGFRDGLVNNQNISIYRNNKKIGNGKVIYVGSNSSSIKVENADLGDKIDDLSFVAVNIRGASEDTYQVSEFKITSKKAKEFFNENELGPQMSQWFSDYLFYNAGKTMLPTKVSNNWISSSTENAFMILVKDGISYTFEMAKPKNEIKLDLTGLTSKITKSNNINTEKIYKIWLKITIPQKNFEKEFDLADAKISVNNMQEYSDKDIFFEMLNKICYDIAEKAKYF